jgi:hypothetical protein
MFDGAGFSATSIPDKGYDTADFVAKSRAAGVTPYVAQNITAHRGSNIDGRKTPSGLTRRSLRSSK